jgi:hypothetical protein
MQRFEFGSPPNRALVQQAAEAGVHRTAGLLVLLERSTLAVRAGRHPQRASMGEQVAVLVVVLAALSLPQ